MNSVLKCSILLLFLGLPAFASGTTLDELLVEIKNLQKSEGKLNQDREQRFLADKQKQAGLLKEAKDALAEQKQLREELKQQFEANQVRLGALDEQLGQQSGELDQLFTVVRQVAADLNADLNSSLVSAQFPGREQALLDITNSQKLPTIGQLEQLWFDLQQEMTETGKVVLFPATIALVDGEPRETEVLRIGAFNALADGKYLRYLSETDQLMVLPRQPAYQFSSLAENISADDNGMIHIGVDPTRGSILDMLLQAPSVIERVHQGGIIGYIILALGAIGVIIVLLRLITLTVTGKKVRAQLQNVSVVNTNNPLGRVMDAAKGKFSEDIETLQLLLDEAIIREVPRLENGQALIKLLAAVAPLLGLLGTVTGMIATFQSISLFGTGDPKLMASGISQALVTTMLGLVVAIPLLFMHSLVVTRSRALVQILDEQSAGIIAKVQEQRLS